MEIERKFRLSAFPTLPTTSVIEQWQGYLSTGPLTEVRIRKTINHTNPSEEYVICVKSISNLVRHEVEAPLTATQFEELSGILEHPLIHKQQRVYALPNGLRLECSQVDEGAFSYAEVEFPDEAAALAWNPPEYLGREMTNESGFKMRTYWSNRIVPDDMK